MPINAWSYSRLSVFEQCKFRAKLAFVDRIPEPERPLPKGKSEHANDRGTRIHTAAELYIQKEVELIPELAHFKAEFAALKQGYKQGIVAVEGEWAVTRDWEPTAWNSSDVWARIKLDAFIRTSPTHAVIVDYKTGKKFGNEIKHAEQCQLYQLAAFLRYPELDQINVELWYTDLDEMTQMSFTRAQGMRFFRNFDTRGAAMTMEDDFPAKPNAFSCQWCPYGPRGTGHCTQGV